jgi:hypothetical protein
MKRSVEEKEKKIVVSHFIYQIFKLHVVSNKQSLLLN